MVFRGECLIPFNGQHIALEWRKKTTFSGGYFPWKFLSRNSCTPLDPAWVDQRRRINGRFWVDWVKCWPSDREQINDGRSLRNTMKNQYRRLYHFIMFHIKSLDCDMYYRSITIFSIVILHPQQPQVLKRGNKGKLLNAISYEPDRCINKRLISYCIHLIRIIIS